MCIVWLDDIYFMVFKCEFFVMFIDKLIVDLYEVV